MAKKKKNHKLYKFEYTNKNGGGKFWNIEIYEDTVWRNYIVETNYGKLGTVGVYSTKSFSSFGHADEYFNKKIAEKTGKGYTEILSKKQLDAQNAKLNAILGMPVSNKISKADLKEIKSNVKYWADHIRDETVQYSTANLNSCEVIVTVLVAGEVFQGTAKSV